MWNIQTIPLFVTLILLAIGGGENKTLKHVQDTEKTQPERDNPSLANHDVHQADTDSVAVSVARTTGYTLFGHIYYPETVVDNGDAWDRSTATLTVPSKSTYFFHMSAGAEPGQPVDLMLRGLQTGAALRRESTAHTGTDTLGRDFIASAEALAQIYVDNGETSNLYGQGGRQTSFTTYDLESMLNPETLTIFSVARESLYASVGEVKFPKAFVNIGGDFDTEGETRMNITKSGIYFFTLSIGVPNRLNIRTQIRSKSRGNSPYAELWRSSDSHDGTDIINTAVMAQLEEGDQVYVRLMDGEIHSDEGHQTFFGGFHYDPAHGVPVAWSVYSDRKHVAFDTPIDPLPFDGVWVNTNNTFRPVINQVYITHSGLYYINLNIGVQAGYTIDASVVLDRNRVETNVYRSSLNHNGPDTLNQGIILRLSAGNRIRVVLGPNSRSHSDGDHQTVFSGFLLQPE